MGKLDSLKKSLDKANITTGLTEPDEWLSTGIHALNFTMTGDFIKAIPNRRSTLLWGESGTGKSFLLSNAALQAQAKGYEIVMIDTETSLHEEYLERVGVNTKENFMAIQATTIEETTKVMSEIFKNYDYTDKVCVIVDSISMLETETDSANFDKGVAKGDQGQQAKRLKKMVKSINAKIGKYDMFFIMSGHAYLNQDILNGEGKWILSGGKGLQFIPSVSVLLTKKKLKEDSDIVGIRINTEVTKTRFTQLGGKTEIPLNYKTGFEPHAGLLELAEAADLVKKNGAWYSYELNGDVVKFQSKNFGDHYRNLFDFDESSEIVENLSELEEEQDN